MARFWFFLAFHHHPGITTLFRKGLLETTSPIYQLKIIVPVSLAEKMVLVIRYCTMHCDPSPVRYLYLYLRYTTTTTDYILILILHGSTCGGGHFFAEQGFASEGKVLGR